MRIEFGEKRIAIVGPDAGKITMGCCADGSCVPETCMNLPASKTCGDCVHVNRCVAMFGTMPTNTWCDFYPRQFHEANKNG